MGKIENSVVKYQSYLCLRENKENSFHYLGRQVAIFGKRCQWFVLDAFKGKWRWRDESFVLLRLLRVHIKYYDASTHKVKILWDLILQLKSEGYRPDIKGLRRCPSEALFRMNEILPGLFLGSSADIGYSEFRFRTKTFAEKQNDVDLLKARNISCILTVSKGLQTNLFPDTQFTKMRVALHDEEQEPIQDYFESSFQFIDDALKKNKGILVHCVAGVSRSSTLVIAYIMKKYGLSLDDAYAFVRSKRQIISPNKGFYQQLRLYEKQLQLENLNYARGLFASR